MKQCTKCKRLLSLLGFGKDSRYSSGLSCQCKDCRNKQAHERYESRKEEFTRKFRKHYKNHKEKYVERASKYYKSHKEEYARRGREYRKTHKKEISEQCREYYKVNKEKISKYNKANREKSVERTTKYKRLHPEIARANNHRYRARRRGGISETFTDLEIFNRDGWICGICGMKINRRLKCPNPRSKSLDHIIPIARGGGHTRLNVQAAHLRCNMSKNAGIGGQLRLIG